MDRYPGYESMLARVEQKKVQVKGQLPTFYSHLVDNMVAFVLDQVNECCNVPTVDDTNEDHLLADGPVARALDTRNDVNEQTNPTNPQVDHHFQAASGSISNEPTVSPPSITQSTIPANIEVKVEDESHGQSVQLCEGVKKEEEDGEYEEQLHYCGFEECEECKVKREMKEELDESGETEQMEDCVKQEIKEELEDGEMMHIKEEEEETNDVTDLADANEGGEADDVNRMSMNNPNGHNDIDTLFDGWMRDEVELGEPTRNNLELMNQDMSNASTSSIQPSNQTNLTNLVDHEEVKNNIQRQFDETNNTGEIGEIQDGNDETRATDMQELTQNEDGDEEARTVEVAQIGTTSAHPIGQSRGNTKQSTRLAKRKHKQAQVRNKVNNRDNQGVEEDNEEVDDRDDNAGEGTSRGAKRPRTSDPIASNVTQKKQVITLNVRCDQLNCDLVFNNDKLLKAHKLDRHSIGACRCLVKHCRQSFTNKHLVGEHLTQSHPHTSQWHCDKCDRHFTAYNHLSSHNIDHHQPGHYQCSYPACTFTEEYKRKVYKHYQIQHKPRPLEIPKEKCQQAGCQYETSDGGDMKKHQRTHSGIKPYKCKWPNCDYSSTVQSNTIRHVRRNHFKLKPSSVPNGAQPKDYVELVRELL